MGATPAPETTLGGNATGVRSACPRSLAAALALTLVALAAMPAAASAKAEAAPRVTTALLRSQGLDPSEPHLAVDPSHPDRLFTVAQVVVPELGAPEEFLWRSRDGGSSWSRSPLLGGSANTRSGLSGDPIVAAGPGGLVLYGTLLFDLHPAAGTATEHVGTRVSTDGGASFDAFGSTDRTEIPLCFFDNSCPPPPPPGLFLLDKPWIAVDAGRGRFRGSVYAVWVRVHFDTGAHELLVAASRDGGRSFGAPMVLDRLSDRTLRGLEELAQVVVRPDGTVDVVWNTLRRGRPWIVHAVSRNGGATFSAPERVVRLRPRASLLGIVSTLAVSPHGRLGLCWSQALSTDRYDATVACKQRGPAGGWSPARRILPREHHRQYLPAVAFRGERLWVAAYVSTKTSTRLVAVRARHRGFGRPLVVNRWQVRRRHVCAPHPPDCRAGQTFIGDYIGLVATRRRVTVAYIAPSRRPPLLNRVLVSSFG